MEVEARDDRHVRTDQATHSSEQFSIRIVDVLGDHCTVQIEVHGVESGAGAQILQQHRNNAFVRVARDVRRGRRRTPGERRNRVTG